MYLVTLGLSELIARYFILAQEMSFLFFKREDKNIPALSILNMELVSDK